MIFQLAFINGNKMAQLRPRKRPVQKRSRETVAAIIKATTQVLVKRGYDKTNTNLIAEIAGVSVGTLYQYFPNKESLILSVVEEHCNEMLELLRDSAVKLAAAPIPVAVSEYVRAMVKAHAVDPQLHATLVTQVLHIGFDHFQQIKKQAIGIVKAYLELHIDEILPKNIDMAAYVLVTTVEGLTHMAALERPDLFDGDALADEVIAVILRYLLGNAADMTIH